MGESKKEGRYWRIIIKCGKLYSSSIIQTEIYPVLSSEVVVADVSSAAIFHGQSSTQFLLEEERGSFGIEKEIVSCVGKRVFVVMKRVAYCLIVR